MLLLLGRRCSPLLDTGMAWSGFPGGGICGLATAGGGGKLEPGAGGVAPGNLAAMGLIPGGGVICAATAPPPAVDPGE